MWSWLFGEWRSVGFVALSTVLIYASTVIGVRLSERRTMAQMSPFDFVVAVALGSIVGRTATAASPSYVQAATALVTLVVLHRFVGWLRTRSPGVSKVTDHPALVLIDRGRLVASGLDHAHLTEGDVWSVLREQGVRRLVDVDLLVLEGSGRFSVLRRQDDPIDDCLTTGLHRLDPAPPNG